ncbi:MAG TPA: PAS domain S-box protein [Halothiobacillus sp.]|nr:PAS domain S-box protein [Halothiobacillus sp.]
MIKAPRPANEAGRLRVLQALDLFNSVDGTVFQREVDILRRVFGVPTALMALADETHQRFIAVHGLPMREIARDLAICSHALLPPFAPLVIADTQCDGRTQHSFLVTEHGIRFYAGAPLVLDGEFAVGTLCIMDTQPRGLDADAITLLHDFALRLSATLQTMMDARRLVAEKKPLVAMGQELQAILQTAAIGIVRIDAGGIIEVANPCAERLFGYTQPELVGQNVAMLMPEPWRSAHDGYLMQYLATRDPKVIGVGRSVLGLHKTGSTFPFNLAVSEIIVDGVSKFVGFILDLTIQKQAEAALAQERALLRSVIDSSVSPIAAVNREGVLLLTNQAFATGLGVAVADLAGKKSNDYLPAAVADLNQAANERVLATGEPHTFRTPIVLQGQARAFETTKSPLRDATGHIIGVVTLGQDVTQLSQMADALARADQTRVLGEQFAEIGFWVLDYARGTIEISPGFARILGLPEDTKNITHTQLRTLIAPEFHAAIDAEFAAAFAQARPFAFEYLTADRARCLRAKGNVVCDAQGQPVQIVGVTQNVTLATQAKANLARQRQLLDGLNLAVQSFLDTQSTERSWSMMLEPLLMVTGAKFGFIGEVLFGVKPDPCLKIHAITNLSWSAESDALFERVMAGDMMFCNPNNLIGLVMKSQEPVVVPHLAGDARRGGFPPGHPMLDNYLGIPLFKGDELVGVVAIANRSEGVDLALAEFLAPFTSTCAIMITSLRERQERARFEHALIESKEQAERANQSKSAFLSSMSHELRTPLNAILGFAQLMQASRKDMLTEKQQGFVAHILKAGQHLLVLVNDVLNLAKIEAGEITLSLEPIALSGLIDEALLMVDEVASAAGIELINCLHGMPCGVVRVDLTRAKQVLLNLLTNAIKYNRPAGKVSIRCMPARPMAEGGTLIGLAIEDTGVGIAADKQHRLFRAFERLGQESSAIEGTGIGLMITKQLVELMGGTLEFASEAGVGTTFTLWLPLTNGPATAALDAPVAAEGAQPPPNPHQNSPKIRVLYVEDNADNRALMQDIADERDDVQLILAHTGEQGLELALSTPHPDLILMDINLPGISGQQAAARLKKWTDTRDIPILALSADATAPSMGAANASGLFAGYLTKPLNLAELMALFDTTAARVLSGRK